MGPEGPKDMTPKEVREILKTGVTNNCLGRLPKFHYICDQRVEYGQVSHGARSYPYKIQGSLLEWGGLYNVVPENPCLCG